jgi:hypothetical protein
MMTVTFWFPVAVAHDTASVASPLVSSRCATPRYAVPEMPQSRSSVHPGGGVIPSFPFPATAVAVDLKATLSCTDSVTVGSIEAIVFRFEAAYCSIGSAPVRRIVIAELAAVPSNVQTAVEPSVPSTTRSYIAQYRAPITCPATFTVHPEGAAEMTRVEDRTISHA